MFAIRVVMPQGRQMARYPLVRSELEPKVRWWWSRQDVWAETATGRKDELDKG